MSYDLEFDCGPLPEKHTITGGTYQSGGSRDPWLNITYNYAPFFYALWPDKGIRSLYGRTAGEVIKAIDAVLPKMKGEPSRNYWDATEGNAKEAPKGLRSLAEMCPADSILSGD